MLSAGARRGKRGELGENPAGTQPEAFRHDLIVFGQGACHVEKVETGSHGADFVHGRLDFPRRSHEVAAAREEFEEGVAQAVRFLFVGEVFLRAAGCAEDSRHGPGGVFRPEGGQNVVPERHVDSGSDGAKKRPGTFTSSRERESPRRLLRGVEYSARVRNIRRPALPKSTVSWKMPAGKGFANYGTCE